MKVIRYGCFETNSSSAHSLSIKSAEEEFDPVFPENPLEIPTHTRDDIGGRWITCPQGSFGWGFEDDDRVWKQWDKLAYLVCMVIETEVNRLIDNEWTRGYKESELCEEYGYKVVPCQELARELVTKTEGMQLINKFLQKHKIRGIDETTIPVVLEVKQTDRHGKMFYIREGGGSDGLCIDHQSCEQYRSLKDFLKCYNVSIDRFVLDPGIEMLIKNDNSCYPESWEDCDQCNQWDNKEDCEDFIPKPKEEG